MPAPAELIPWERFPKESAPAFEAFATYRDMGADRTVRAVAATLHKSLQLMGRWSSRWEWVERAHAWDTELDRIATETSKRFVADQAAKMTERHLRGALLLQRKAIEKINLLTARELTPANAARYYELAVNIERLAVGEPTSREEHQHRGGVSPVDPALVERVATDANARRAALELLAAVSGEDATDAGASGVGGDQPPMAAG